MSAGPYNNSFLATLPSTAFAVINESATLTPKTSHFYTGQVFEEVLVKPIDDDYYHLNKKNPFKKPTHERVWRLDYGASSLSKLLYVIEDDNVLTSVRVHYYTKPAPIIVESSSYVAGDGSIDGVALTGFVAADQDCVLNEITHRDIVERAVRLAFAALQDEKGFQISSAQEQQK